MKTICVVLLVILGSIQAIKFSKLSEDGNLKYYKRFLHNQGSTVVANEANKAANSVIKGTSKGIKDAFSHLNSLKVPHGYNVATPTNFGDRQRLRNEAHNLRKEIRQIKQDNHENNVKQERHINSLEASRDDYVANNHSGTTSLEQQQTQVKYQINHDEKYREKYLAREVTNDKRAERDSSQPDKKRLLKLANFDKKRSEVFAKLAHHQFDKLQDLQNEETDRDAKLSKTVGEMDHKIHSAEQNAYKVREEGEDTLRPVVYKEKKIEDALHRGHVANGAGVNDRNVKKVTDIVNNAHEQLKKIK